MVWCTNTVNLFDVEREYRQRRMSGAGQDLFQMSVTSSPVRRDQDRDRTVYFIKLLFKV